MSHVTWSMSHEGVEYSDGTTFTFGQVININVAAYRGGSLIGKDTQSVPPTGVKRCKSGDCGHQDHEYCDENIDVLTGELVFTIDEYSIHLKANGTKTHPTRFEDWSGTIDDVYIQTETIHVYKNGSEIFPAVNSPWARLPEIQKNKAAAMLGSSKSPAKTAANRLNAKQPRPNAQGKKKPRKPKTE